MRQGQAGQSARAEQEVAEKARAEQEVAEKIEKARAEKENGEKENAVKEKAEQEKAEKEKAEKEEAENNPAALNAGLLSKRDETREMIRNAKLRRQEREKRVLGLLEHNHTDGSTRDAANKGGADETFLSDTDQAEAEGKVCRSVWVRARYAGVCGCGLVWLVWRCGWCGDVVIGLVWCRREHMPRLPKPNTKPRCNRQKTYAAVEGCARALQKSRAQTIPPASCSTLWTATRMD